MSFTRVNLDSTASRRLSILKKKTGLTPNLLARLSIVLSLKEIVIPDYERYDSKGMEMNRNTLFGDYDNLLMGMVLVWMKELKLNLDDETIRKVIVYHVNNGVVKLQNIIKTDFDELVDYITK